MYYAKQYLNWEYIELLYYRLYWLTMGFEYETYC